MIIRADCGRLCGCKCQCSILRHAPSVVAWGDAVFVSDTSKVKQVLEMICIKYLDCSPEITEGMAERTCVVSIRVNSVTGREEKS